MKKILRAISQTASPQSLIEFLVLWHSTRILQFWVKSSIYGVPKPMQLYPNIGNGPTNRLQKVLEPISEWSLSKRTYPNFISHHYGPLWPTQTSFLTTTDLPKLHFSPLRTTMDLPKLRFSPLRTYQNFISHHFRPTKTWSLGRSVVVRNEVLVGPCCWEMKFW